MSACAGGVAARYTTFTAVAAVNPADLSCLRKALPWMAAMMFAPDPRTVSTTSPFAPSATLAMESDPLLSPIDAESVFRKALRYAGVSVSIV